MSARAEGDEPAPPPDLPTGRHALRRLPPHRTLAALLALVLVAGALTLVVASMRHRRPAPSATGAATPTTVTSSPLPLGTRPDASTTGPAVGVALRLHRGDLVLARAGQVASRLHVTGDLYLDADRVAAVDVLVDGTVHMNQSPGGNYSYPVTRGQRLLRVSARGIDTVGLRDLTIDRTHISGASGTLAQMSDFADGSRYFAASGLTVRDSLFDGLRRADGTGGHFEALHLLGVTHVVLDHDAFDFEAPDAATLAQVTAVVTVESSVHGGAVCDDLRLTDSWLTGGGFYQLYLFATRAVVTGNRFARGGVRPTAAARAPADAVQYPPSAYDAPYPRFRAADNTLDGRPLTLPGAS